ncbi:MAG: (deoxy)nucleoside triphosphate pyrophosphohydrolase [Desulfuromonadales bacterium]|nr:(deoxy)nucleoside triphosphate pyrophosphohydrolase [Desulfuromonadales bacterium]
MDSNTNSPLLVTAAIIEHQGRVLVTRRPADKRHPLAWEFPGGKMEANETPQQALQRELLEELAIEVVAESIFDVVHYRYDWGAVLILAYWCRWTGGAIKHLEVDDHRWVTPAELGEMQLLPADQPLVEHLQQLDIPS